MKKILIGLIIFCVMFTACDKEQDESKEYYDKNYVLVFEVEGNFVDTDMSNTNQNSVISDSLEIQETIKEFIKYLEEGRSK